MLDGTMRIVAHPRASVQFAGESLTGIHMDASVVYNDDWHPASTPQPGPVPAWLAQAVSEAEALAAFLKGQQVP